MASVTVTETLPVNQIAVSTDNPVTSVTVADATSIYDVRVAESGPDITVTLSADAAGVSSLNGLTGVVTVQEAVSLAGQLEVPGSLVTGTFLQGEVADPGTFAVYAENPVFHGYNLTIGGTDSGDNRQGITFASSTPTGQAYLYYNDLNDKIEQSRDGVNWVPVPVNTTELAEGTNLYYTDARADARVQAGIAAINYPVDSVNGQTNTVVLDTDDIAEGTANLYYTDARADARVNAGIAAIDYPVDSVNGKTNTVVLTTTDIAEGTNLYYTDARFDTRLASKTTTNLAEGTNLYYTAQRFDDRLATKTTDNLNEGSTNKYFTTTRARQSIQVVDTGGDGSLSYDNSTGNITYTGPSASEVRAHFTAGVGVSITDGSIAIGQAVGTTSNVTFNDGVFNGNLTVNGTTTYVNTTDLNVKDREITLNYNQTGTPTQNAGVIIERGDETNSALTWVEADDKWYQNRAGVSTVIPISTTELNEGTNLYYTTVRANSDFDTRLATKSTTDLAEGTNLYYTTARANSDFDTRLATKTTDNLSEGSTNKYYLDSRARAAISVTDTGGDGSLAYDNSTGVITYTGPSATEVRAHFSATDAGGDGSFSYDNSTGVFTYTGPSATEVRAHFSVTDTGGDGSLSYDNSTGVITYTGPSASEVRAHFSGGTGVTYDNSTGVISIGQAVATTSDVMFRTVDVTRSITAGDAAIGSSGEIGAPAVFDATGAATGSTMQLGLRSENVTSGFGTTNAIVDHGQNRPSGTATTSGNPNLYLESTRGTAAAPTATGANDTIGAINFGGHDGVRGLASQVNGASIQLIGIAGQAFLNNGTHTTQAGATTILRSQPNNLRLTSVSRQNILLANYVGGTTNTPPTQNLLFNSTSMATQYDAAGNAINGHGRQDISFFHPTIGIFGVPSQSTANADNSTLPGSNVLSFYSSRQSGWAGRRDIVENNDTLAQIRVFGQTTNNSTGNGSQTGTIEFTAAETFSTTLRGSRFNVQTGRIGTNILENRITVDSNSGAIKTTRLVQSSPYANGGEISMKSGVLNGATDYEKSTELSVTALTTDGTRNATYETKTNRFDGTNYSPTQTGDLLGRFTFLGNYGSSTAPLVNNAAGYLTVAAAENFTSTASGATISMNANKIGSNDTLVVFSANSSTAQVQSDVFSLRDSAMQPLKGNKIEYARVYGQWQYDTTVTPAASNTAYAFPIASGVVDFANIATVGSTSRIIPGAAGMYKLQFSVQIQNDDSASEHIAYLWWRKNGTDVPGSMGQVGVVKATGAVNGLTIAGWDNMISSANTTDYWELMYAVDDAAHVDFPTFAATAFGPSTASLFITLVPIGA